MGRPLFEILEGWLLLWSPSLRFETQYDYFVKASQSQWGFRRGRLALLWPPPPLFETKDYYFEIAKTMEGRSLFLSTQQTSVGSGAKPPEAEAVFRFQRVILTIKYGGARQWRFRRGVFCSGRLAPSPHLKRNTIIWQGQKSHASGALWGEATSSDVAASSPI